MTVGQQNCTFRLQALFLLVSTTIRPLSLKLVRSQLHRPSHPTSIQFPLCSPQPTHPPSSNYNQSRGDGAVNQTVNCHFGRFCLSCLCLSVSCHCRSQTRLSLWSSRIPATFLFPPEGGGRRVQAQATNRKACTAEVAVAQMSLHVCMK